MEGTIVKKDLVYNGTRVPFPISLVFGVSAQVSIFGRNDHTSPIVLGAHWTVTDPDNITAQSITLWGWALTAVGGQHGFEADPIRMNKPGTWTISVELLTNPDSPIVLDSYNGTLCNVLSSPEEFLGSIIDKRVLYDSSPAAFSSDFVIGTEIQVVIGVQNLLETTQDMGMHWIVKNPNGVEVQEYSVPVSGWGVVPPGLGAIFTGIKFALDVIGTWTIEVELLMDPNNPTVVDSFSGSLVDILDVPENGVPDYKIIRDYLYPLASTFEGNVEECTFTFSLLPEQIPGTDWAKDQIINAFESEVEAQGASMIKLQVYEDKTPFWHTDYKIIATSTASPLPWSLIITLVLAIMVIISVTFLIVQVRTFLWGAGGEVDGDGGLLTGLGDLIPMMIIMMMMTMIMPEVTKAVQVVPGEVVKAAKRIPGEVVVAVKREAPKLFKKAVKEAKELF